MRIHFRKALALMISLLMLCTLLPLGAMTSVSAAETIVFNADFENNSISGWYTSGSGAMSVVSTSELPVANAACGSYVMKKVQPTGEYSWQEYQTGFTVTANTDYIASVDVLTTSNNWPIQAFVSSSTWITAILGQTEQVKCSSSEWTTLTFEFNSGNNTKLYPSVKSAWENTTLYIDNFKIVKKEVAAPDTPTGGNNLVTNGDFENGNTGWRFSSAASVVSGGYTGSAVQLNNPAAWSEAGYQEVAVEANETYTLTWRSKRVSGSGVFNMELAKAPYDGTKPQVTAVTNQTWMNDTSGNWINHKVTIKMTDANGNGISKIMIKLTTEATNPGVLLIDDICLTKNLTASFDGYIYNGDFEVGSTDNWSVHNGTTASTAAKYTGNYGAYLESDGSWGGIMSQATVNVVAGKTYIVSYYIKVTDKAIGIQIKDGTTSSGSQLISQTHNAGDWKLVTHEVKPTQNGLFINFHGSGGATADPNNIGKAYLDDIKVELKGGKPEEKIEFGGSSVRDVDPSELGTGLGLAFKFTVQATAGMKNSDNTYVESSAKIALSDIKYDLVRMGAVMTNDATVGQNAANFTLAAVNNKKVIDIPAVYLNGADAESLSFAVRILDIPERHIGTAIYARPYYVYLENGQEVTVYGDTRSNNYAKAANISTADKSSIKILSIGHSFSKDVMVTNLWNMFKEGGYENVTIAYLYMAGCSMPKHLYNINNNLAQYEYAKNTNGTWVEKNNTSALTALKEEEWDFVTVQSSPDYIGGQTISSITLGVNSEGSKIEGINQTEYEAMGEITDWILANATNADVKIDYHMIWSFSEGCNLWSYTYHDWDQMTMYNNIVNITQQKVQTHEDINRIIPSATAIQNARSSFMGDTFNMPDATQGGNDGYHLNDRGDYVAALTWYCHYSGDNANIMAGYTGVLSTTEFLAVAEAVNNAIDIPYAVTQSTHTEG